MKENVFVVTKSLASFLEEGTLVRVLEILEDKVIIEKTDTDGLMTTIQISVSMTRYLWKVYQAE
jgi:hypothetical protein